MSFFKKSKGEPLRDRFLVNFPNSYLSQKYHFSFFEQNLWFFQFYHNIPLVKSDEKWLFDWFLKKFDQKVKKLKMRFKIRFFQFYEKVVFWTCFLKKHEFLLIFMTRYKHFCSKNYQKIIFYKICSLLIFLYKFSL